MHLNLQLPLKRKLHQFLLSQKAVSTTEYALLIAIIVIAIAVILVMIIIGVESYKEGQQDAIMGKWKYEADTAYIEVKKIQ